MDSVPHPFIIAVAELCQHSQPMKSVIVVVHWEVEGSDCSVHRHPFVMVRFVQTMHEQELGTFLNRPFHPSRPFSPWDLRVRPERRYCRHEGAVPYLHPLELRVITIPAAILELCLRHPIDGSSDARVLVVS